MSATSMTRESVDRAESLDFTPAPKARQDLTITVKARVGGFDTEIVYTGSIDQLLSVTKRLRELGAEPVVSAPAAAPVKVKAQRVEPAYNDSGEPICPTHKKPLREGQYGLYCPAKDASTERGYCALKFKD